MVALTVFSPLIIRPYSRGGYVESPREAITNRCVYLRFFAFTELLTRARARDAAKSFKGIIRGIEFYA